MPPIVLQKSLLVLGSFFYKFQHKRSDTCKLQANANILLIKLDHIGDFILSTPFIRELRKNCPDAFITLVVAPECFNLAETCPDVDEVVSFDWKWAFHRPDCFHIFNALSFAYRKLWHRSFDLAIVARYDVDLYDASLLCFFSGAKNRVAYEEKVTELKAGWNKGYDKYFTRLVPDVEDVHEVKKNLHIIKGLGGSVDEESLELWLQKDDRTYAESLLKDVSAIKIAVAHGATQGKRCYPLESYAELIKYIEKHFLELGQDSSFIILGSKEDNTSAENLQKQCFKQKLINLCGQTTLRQSLALISLCKFLISNDSAPAHLAAAQKVPCLVFSCHAQNASVFHHNAPERFHPWENKHIVLRPSKSKRPCIDGCEANEAHCILDIDVELAKLALRNDFL